MTIRSIIIEGVPGDVSIERQIDGATVVCEGEEVCKVSRGESDQAVYAKAQIVARYIYGTHHRSGLAKATNSMIHDVMREIDRVAGR